jgi:hypothetical protein
VFALRDIAARDALRAQMLVSGDYEQLAISVASDTAYGAGEITVLVIGGKLAASRVGTGSVAADTGVGWTRVGRWMNPEEHANLGDTGVVQWNEQGVSHVLNPPNPAAYRAAPPGDIYVEYDVPTGVLSPHSEGSSIIYGPDSFVAKLPGRAQLGDVPVRNILIPGS